MKGVRWMWAGVPAFWVLAMVVARGYLVGPPPALEAMAGKADVVFQGTVVSNTTVQDGAFQAIPGFIVEETEFRPAWALKGKPGDGDVKFRHYAPDPHPAGFMYEPQSYSFTVGKSYMVFAKQPADYAAGTCQQLWMNPLMVQDAGVLLCFRPEPFGSFGREPMKEIYWRDLTELLKSKDPKEVVYAIEHLDEMGAGHNRRFGRMGTLAEFERLEVLKAVQGLMASPDASVAQAALGVVGSYNPYMTREAQQWLATVGSATTPGYDKSEAKFVNDGGMIYWREIAAVADSKVDEATREMAVRALGLVKEPSLQVNVARWLSDPSPAVARAAVLLLADYPELATHDRMMAVATSEDGATRTAVAYAIGFGQYVEDADVLTGLMGDADAQVRQAAALSLLSFSPKDKRIAKIFRDNLANKEFRVLFLVGLCQADPAGNLDLLIEETASKADPENWPGGQIPAYTTSHLLWGYLNAQPAADLQAGKYDKALDALEIWQPNYSVDPASVYDLELRAGLTERAKKFRVAAEKVSPYDLEPSFKRVDGMLAK